MILPLWMCRLMCPLGALMAVWSAVTVCADLDHEHRKGDDTNVKLQAVPGPNLPIAPPTFHGGGQDRLNVQQKLPSLLKRRSTTSQALNEMLPQSNLQPKKHEMGPDLREITEDSSKELMSPRKNMSEVDTVGEFYGNNSTIMPVLVTDSHYERTLSGTPTQIDAAGYFQQNHSNNASSILFQIDSSYKDCSGLTRQSLDVIKDSEHFLDWPSLFQSIGSCCSSIHHEHTSLQSIYASMCGDYTKLIKSQEGSHEVTAGNFTETLITAVAKAIVAADEGKQATEPDGAISLTDELPEQGISKPIIDRVGGRILVLFVPQLNATISQEDNLGERGEDLARHSILKIIKAKILKSFKQFEKWLSSQSTPMKES